MTLIYLLDSLQNHIIADDKGNGFAHINMPEQIFCLLVKFANLSTVI